VFVKQSPRAQEARAEDKSTSPQGIFQAVKTNSAERPVIGMLLSLVMSLQSHLYLRLWACGSQVRFPLSAVAAIGPLVLVLSSLWLESHTLVKDHTTL
jgi:hypothetical protein